MGEACSATAPDAVTPYARRQPERTVLYQAVASQLETSLEALEVRGRSVPGFVRDELRAFLRCGILRHGCCRVRCTGCGHSKVVAFSCKCRGFCPSCAGRRMASTAKHIVERVSPDAKTGTITFTQCFGSSLNLNVHFHTLALDGVYTEDEGALRWHDVVPPSDEAVASFVDRLARKLVAKLTSLGVIDEEGLLMPPSDEAQFEAEQSWLPGFADASVQGRIASGERAGSKVERVGDRIRIVDARGGGDGGDSLRIEAAAACRTGVFRCTPTWPSAAETENESSGWSSTPRVAQSPTAGSTPWVRRRYGSTTRRPGATAPPASCSPTTS